MRGADDVPPLAKLADNPQGQDSVFLTDNSGPAFVLIARAARAGRSTSASSRWVADPRR